MHSSLPVLGQQTPFKRLYLTVPTPFPHCPVPQFTYGGSPLPVPLKVTSMSPRSPGLVCQGLVELSSAANPLGVSCQIIN